jgi:hypothetical protein
MLDYLAYLTAQALARAASWLEPAAVTQVWS